MTALVIGGMHGNETAGYLAAEQIANWTPDSGSLLVLPRANAIGVANGDRETNGDLNRQFPLETEPTTALARAIWDVVTDYSPDLIVDLHESWSRYVSGGLGQSVAYSPVRNLRGAATIACDTVNETIAESNDRFHERLLPSPAEYPHGVFVQRTAFELGIPSYLIETYVGLEQRQRVEYQLSLVKKLLDVRTASYDAGEPAHVLAIQGSGTPTSYEGTVDGSVSTTDYGDNAADGSFAGTVTGEMDYYRFDGRLTDFTVTRGDPESIELRLDGVPKTIDELTPNETSRLTVRSTGDPVEYQLGVDEPFVAVEHSADDWVFEDRAYGVATETVDSYEYAYDLDQFDVTEGDPADLALSVNGEPVEIDDLDETPTHELLIRGQAGRTTYRLTVSGTLDDTSYLNPSDRIVGSTAEGAVTTYTDMYRFTGDILSFEVVSGDPENVDLILDGNNRTVDSLNPASVHTLTIDSTGDRVDYSGEVSGTVYPTPLLNGADAHGVDRFSGYVNGYRDQYLFKGELTEFSIDSGHASDVVVSVDGTEITPGAPRGSLVEGRTIAIDDPWQTYAFDRAYESPVTVCNPLSYAGSDPCHARLRNVSSTQFEARIEEWNYLNEIHFEETAGHLTMETGVHEIDAGRYGEAGRTVTGHGWKRVTFETAFDSTPIVFCQAETEQGKQAIVTRVRNVTRNGFEVRLQESERRGTHRNESIGYIAIDPAVEHIGGSPAELGTVGVDSTWRRIDFDRTYDRPVFVAGMQSFDGHNTVGLRRRNLTSDGVELFAEEETSADDETRHLTERVGYLVFEQ